MYKIGHWILIYFVENIIQTEKLELVRLILNADKTIILSSS
jgi:hypothetical protein